MLVAVYEESELKNKETFIAATIISIMILMSIIPVTMKASVFFSLLILLVPKMSIVNLILSSKFMQFIGNISWGVYSFHWPIFCSVGLLALLKAVDAGISLKYAYPFIIILAALLTLVLSIIFAKSFEPLSFYIIKKIQNKLFVKQQ